MTTFKQYSRDYLLRVQMSQIEIPPGLFRPETACIVKTIAQRKEEDEAEARFEAEIEQWKKEDAV